MDASISTFGRPLLYEQLGSANGQLEESTSPQNSPNDDDWIRYEDFDYDRVADTHAIDAEESTKTEGAPLPPGKSWVFWSVTVPNRLALVTLFSIGVYEILVAVSMAVRSLRLLMVNGLMHALLIWNGLLLLFLAGLVLKARTGFTFEFLSKAIHRKRRIQED